MTSIRHTGTGDTMGTPIPPILQPKPGVLCENCWGIDKDFGVGPTPDIVRVQIEGVEKDVGWLPGDGEPPNDTFTWIQQEGAPCQFDDDLPIPLAGITFTDNNTLVGASSSTGVLAFSGQTLSKCQVTIDNGLSGKFHLGTATLLL